MVDTDVYVPGFWQCAKCEFSLVQSSLNANTGNVSAADNTGENCPNCDVPLWRVSWKDHAKEAHERLDATWNQAVQRCVDEATKAGEGYWNSMREDRYATGYVNGVLKAVENIEKLTLETDK